MIAQRINGNRITAFESRALPVRHDGHRTIRPVVPQEFPLTDLRCFPTIRIVPVEGKCFLRATCRIRYVPDVSEACPHGYLESNLLDVGFWDSCEAEFWRLQMFITLEEAAKCEAAALTLVI